MDENKNQNEDKLHVKGSLDDVLRASAVDTNELSGFAKTIIEKVKEHITEKNYNDWTVCVYSSFNEYRKRVEGAPNSDSFISFYCNGIEAKEMYKYFTVRGMMGANNNDEDVENPIGILFLKK